MQGNLIVKRALCLGNALCLAKIIDVKVVCKNFPFMESFFLKAYVRNVKKLIAMAHGPNLFLFA